MSKKEKTPKIEKIKKSKYPEGYIGRPKPMKTKTFTFQKPGKKFYIALGFWLIVIAFLTYIVIRLVNVGKFVQPNFETYKLNSDKVQDTYVLENKDIKFELDSKTTYFTITQKDSGKVWYSNPKNALTDPKALTKEKNLMMSPFLIKYSTITGTDDIYDLYSNCIKSKSYSIQAKKSSITVNYTVGKVEKEFIIPLAIYQSEMDKWCSSLTKSQKNAVLRGYHKYNRSTLEKDEFESFKSKYPDIEHENLYLIFENAQDFVKKQIQDTFEKVGYKYEDYEKNRAMYKEVTISEEPAFNMSVIYSLENNSFKVEVPFEKIAYKNKYPIVQLSVLPYFGAGYADEKGYLFVPEGGGAIINFNNGKLQQSGYYSDVYGWDWALDRKAVNTETKVAFPVFGIASIEAPYIPSKNNSFISIIREGSGYAGITAEIAGKKGSYNYARADYTMLHREQFDISSRNISAQYSYEQGLPVDEKIEQIFIFVNSSSYSDMAKAYRNYLFKDEQRVSNNSTPLVVEIVGAIEKVQQVAGMPKIKPYKLTSYNQTANIINRIEQLGIKNANIKLSGFINDGIDQTLMTKIKFISELGGKKQFKRMIEQTKNTSSKLYLDGAVQTAHRTSFFKGFNKYKDAARFVSDELCELYEYSPIWYGKMDWRATYFLVNKKVARKGAQKLLQAAKKYNLSGISFRDNGSVLSADYNKKQFTSRNQSMLKQQEEFAEIKKNKLGLIVNAGNDYSLKSTDYITNMVLHGNSYAILDESVPFYQIAIHGYKNFTTTPINLAYEKEQLILESAEVGAGLYFTFIGDSEEKLQETNYSQYFSTNYDKCENDFKDIYSKYDSEISKVKDALIDYHINIGSNVTKTMFDNGYNVYVNFGYQDYTTKDGILIPARNFIVINK